MTLSRSLRGMSALLGVVWPLASGAQAVAITRNSASTITADSLRAVTVAYTVGNPATKAVTLTPEISPPADWTIVTGSSPFSVEAKASELWVVGLSIPPGTPAGTYRIAIAAGGSADHWIDEVRIVVAETRRIETAVMARPSYALAGSSYHIRFVVRNTGNSQARVAVSARSARGRASIASPTEMVMPPGSAAPVSVKVSIGEDLGDEAQDVVTIEATIADDHSIRSDASASIPVVPKPGKLGSRVNTVATNLRIRPIGFGGGIAPLEFSGGGKLREDGEEQVDLYCRGPVRGRSPLGERDECRAEVRAPDYKLRAGDYPYGFSPLTTTGESGMGAGADITAGALQLGAFAEHFRWNPFGGNEGGAYIGWKPSKTLPNRIALNVVDRSRADLKGLVASAQSSWKFGPLGILEMEYAGSRSDGVLDDAKSARMSRNGTRTQYDIGLQRAGPEFAGSQRGAAYRYANGTIQLAPTVSAHGSYNRYDVKRAGLFVAPIDETLAMANAGVTLFNRLNIDAVGTQRTERRPFSATGVQRGLRAGGGQQIGFLILSGDYEVGRTQIESGIQRGYKRYSISPRVTVRGQTLGAFYSYDDGNSALGEAAGSTALGIDGAIRIRNLSFSFNALRMKPKVLDDRFTTQADARASYTLQNGHAIGFRAHAVDRVLHGVSLRDNQNAFYFEYGLPLNLPVFPRRGPGRVEGRVIDETTRKGVPGMLVGVGGKSGLTDRNGRVFFRGLEPGEYALVVGDEKAAAGSVLAGDSRVTVGREARKAARFNVALAPGGEVSVAVRRYVTVQSDTSAARVDVMADVGPLAQVMIQLAGARDTLYEITDAEGVANFGNVPPGTWHASVVAVELPAFHAFEPPSVDVRVESRKPERIEFRLIPVKRKLKILADDTTAGEAVIVRQR